MTETKKVFIFGDLSQAESRVVAWKGPVPKLKQWFIDHRDVHMEIAKMIGTVVHQYNVILPNNLFLRKNPDNYVKDDEERQVAKTTGHANNYGQGAARFASVVRMPKRQAGVLQELYHGELPEIRAGYQRGIIEQITKTRILTVPSGRRIVFYDVINEDMFREGFAWYPQNVVGDIVIDWFNDVQEIFQNDKAPFTTWTPYNIRSMGLDVRLQIHDALGVVVPDDRASIDYAVKILREKGERTVVINNEPLIIPVDFKIGYNWGQVHDYV